MNNKEKMIEILKEHQPEIDEKTLTLDTKVSDLGIDSLNFIQVIFSVESAFGIEILDEELTELHTIGDFLNCLENKEVRK
jgi:acyl carrier protein